MVTRALTKKEVCGLSFEGQLEYYGDRLEMYLGLIKRGAKLDFPSPNRCRKWAIKAAHAAYKLHPELREENSLERYFVAKVGRRMGITGNALSRFVDRAYRTGKAESFIPDWLKAMRG